MIRSALTGFATVATLTAPALAADVKAWYPIDCMSIDYCAPVENAKWIVPPDGAAPRLLVASKHGTAFVQRNFAIQESEDGRIHVCMRYDPFGELEVTCLLVPTRAF